MASNSNAETYDGCSDWEVEHVSAHQKATLEGMQKIKNLRAASRIPWSLIDQGIIVGDWLNKIF